MSNVTQPSHTALRLGAIHKKPSVSNRMYVVQTLSSSMWAKAIGLGLSTLHGYDHYELICAEPDPVSGGTGLAKYPSLCQPLERVNHCSRSGRRVRRGRAGGGGAHTAKRRGGRRDTVSLGDDSGMRRRKNPGMAQKRWQFVLLLTATPRVGGWGGFGDVMEFTMGSPGKRKEEVLSGHLLQQSRDGASSSSMRGTIAAVWTVEHIGWILATVAPIHKRLANSGGGGGSGANFTSSLGCCEKQRDEGGGNRVGETLGGSHVLVLDSFAPG